MNGLIIAFLIALNILWWLVLSKRFERRLIAWVGQRWDVEIRPSERFRGTWEIHPNDHGSLRRDKRMLFGMIQTLYPLLTLIFAFATLFFSLWLLARAT